MTERELASELVIQMLRAGADSEMPFAPIVGSGPNSANPHYAPADRKLTPGDLVVIDWGAYHQGYVSDLTRTFAVGEVDAELRKIARIVLEANAAGQAAGRPGVAAGVVDHAARGVIDQAGYGAYFRHRVGHGIGMEGHEGPYMFGENPLLLSVGMTYTVEPGIYLAGRGGVRIEDNMVVTADVQLFLRGTPCKNNCTPGKSLCPNLLSYKNLSRFISLVENWAACCCMALPACRRKCGR
jgi:Xaa-Pro dipeptidase